MSRELPSRVARVRGLPLAVFVAEDRAQAAAALARQIAALIADAPPGRGPALGLAAGRSPTELYRELARCHREEGLSFAGASAFALDEYLGLPPAHPASFSAYLRAELLERIDLPAERAHFLDGRIAPQEVQAHCERYERAIRAAGGIDLLVLGIGPNGHLAFNEPGSPRDSRTRLVELSAETRRASRASFPPGEGVPERALSMGLATILEARRLRALAFGGEKADVVRRALSEPISSALPATFLREHPDCELWLDRAAAAALR